MRTSLDEYIEFLTEYKHDGMVKDFSDLVLKSEVEEKCLVNEEELRDLPYIRMGNFSYIYKSEISHPLLRLEVEQRCTNLGSLYPVSLMAKDFGISKANEKSIRKHSDIIEIGGVAFYEYPQEIKEFIDSNKGKFVLTIVNEDEEDEGYDCSAKLSL